MEATEELRCFIGASVIALNESCRPGKLCLHTRRLKILIQPRAAKTTNSAFLPPLAFLDSVIEETVHEGGPVDTGLGGRRWIVRTIKCCRPEWEAELTPGSQFWMRGFPHSAPCVFCLMSSVFSSSTFQ